MTGSVLNSGNTYFLFVSLLAQSTFAKTYLVETEDNHAQVSQKTGEDYFFHLNFGHFTVATTPETTESTTTVTETTTTATETTTTITVAPPAVTVAPPEVTVAPPEVTDVQPAITVAPPEVTVAPPAVTVAPPEVTVAPPAVTVATPVTVAPPVAVTPPAPVDPQVSTVVPPGGILAPTQATGFATVGPQPDVGTADQSVAALVNGSVSNLAAPGFIQDPNNPPEEKRNLYTNTNFTENSGENLEEVEEAGPGVEEPEGQEKEGGGTGTGPEWVTPEQAATEEEVEQEVEVVARERGGVAPEGEVIAREGKEAELEGEEGSREGGDGALDGE